LCRLSSAPLSCALCFTRGSLHPHTSASFVVEGSSLAPLLAAALEEARRRASSADSAGSTGSAGSAGGALGSWTAAFALAIAVLEEELAALRVA